MYIITVDVTACHSDADGINIFTPGCSDLIKNRSFSNKPLIVNIDGGFICIMFTLRKK